MANKRLRAYRELAEKLRALFDTGDIPIEIRNGRMVVRLSNAIMFDSGRAELKPQGREALRKIVTVLKEARGRKFIVAGHTDNVPINKKSLTFKSNRELSGARALAVLRFLEDAGMPPEQLAHAGYGEFLTLVANDTAEGRAQNRRTEIIIEPMIDEIPVFPDQL